MSINTTVNVRLLLLLLLLFSKRMVQNVRTNLLPFRDGRV